MDRTIEGYDDVSLGLPPPPKSTVTDDIRELEILDKNKFLITKELKTFKLGF